jgi:RHS repeat-associated protein
MGNKLRKITSDGVKTDYVNGIEYKDDALESVYHSEGRVIRRQEQTSEGSGIVYIHEYSIKDHLGNSRIMFSDLNEDGKLTIGGEDSEILQEAHYYPFGMNMEGNWVPQVGVKNKYLYNGKELNEDFGLDWLDYGFRWYDPSIGRFTGVDPISDQFAWVSTYNYAENEPIAHIDLWGLQKVKPEDEEIPDPCPCIPTPDPGPGHREPENREPENMESSDKLNLGKIGLSFEIVGAGQETLSFLLAESQSSNLYSQGYRKGLNNTNYLLKGRNLSLFGNQLMTKWTRPVSQFTKYANIGSHIGKFGTFAGAVSIGFDFQDYRAGKISLERVGFRAIGVGASAFAGFRIGGPFGALISTEFYMIDQTLIPAGRQMLIEAKRSFNPSNWFRF